MRLSFTPLSLLALLVPTQAVLYGDEQFGDLPGGRFWAFYNEGIAVIDPDKCVIETTITQDQDGKPLPSSWNDVVYMQYDNPDDGTLEGYVMAGSRVDYSNELGDAVSDAYAISTTDRKVVETIQVGPRGVHTYAVWPRNEFWSHSDGDGHFYVIHLGDLSKHTHKVSAHSEEPHHGKLLWDEDPATLGNRGFATATGEQFLFQVDLETKAQTAKYDYSGDIAEGTCRGLHAISYSAINQHVYTECSGGGGTLEFDVSNGDIRFVHQHLSATGALYETPDGSFVVASNKGGNMLHVFTPNGSGTRSSIETEVNMPGHPSTVSFLPNGKNGKGDFIACSPLTENLNQKHRNAAGELVCDYYVGCTGATTAEDVANGICLHNEDGMQLARVTEEVTDDNPACARCADSANFEDNGECVCTPNCGSCDADPQYDDSNSGYMCVDLGDAISGTVTDATLIPNTGGMKQGRPYGGTADCSFGRTYRVHKRGGDYDAAVASAPENSIQIVNMKTKTKKCQVDLPGEPMKVTYAPAVPTKLDGMEGITGEGESLAQSSATGSVGSSWSLMGLVGFILIILG